MSLIPKTSKSTVLLLFLLGATVTALAYWLIPTPSIQHSPETEKDNWQILVSKQENDMDFLNKLNDQNLWGNEGNDEGSNNKTDNKIDNSKVNNKKVVPKKTPKVSEQASKGKKVSKKTNVSDIPQGDWQLFGIVNEGKIRYALLQGEDEKIKRYKKGDLLAKNVKLVAISNNFVQIKRAEKKETKDLYAKTLEDMKKEQSGEKSNKEKADVGKNAQKPAAPKKKELTAAEKRKQIEEMRKARRAKARAAKAKGN